MMEDVIYTGQVSEMMPLIKAISWAEDALMIVEQIPDHQTETLPCQEGIGVGRLNKKTAFESWPVGRVCDADKELTWTRTEDAAAFRVVYSGAAIPLPDTLQQTEGVSAWNVSEPQPYILWGASLPPENPDADTFPFAEVQIPRILQYPIGCQERNTRLQVKIICYHDPKTGEMQHYRFQTMEPVSNAEGGTP